MADPGESDPVPFPVSLSVLPNPEALRFGIDSGGIPPQGAGAPKTKGPVVESAFLSGSAEGAPNLNELELEVPVEAAAAVDDDAPKTKGLASPVAAVAAALSVPVAGFASTLSPPKVAPKAAFLDEPITPLSPPKSSFVRFLPPSKPPKPDRLELEPCEAPNTKPEAAAGAGAGAGAASSVAVLSFFAPKFPNGVADAPTGVGKLSVPVIVEPLKAPIEGAEVTESAFASGLEPNDGIDALAESVPGTEAGSAVVKPNPKTFDAAGGAPSIDVGARPDAKAGAGAGAGAPKVGAVEEDMPNPVGFLV